MEITFATLFKRDEAGGTFPVARLTVDVRGRSGALYDLEIHPDGSFHYQRNSAGVADPFGADGPPNRPFAYDALRTRAACVRDDVVALLALPHDGPAYRDAWWSLRTRFAP